MLTSYLQKMRLLNRNARLYILSSVFTGFAYLGIETVLLNLYLLRLGYGPDFTGFVFAVGSLTMTAVSLPAGALSRQLGVRRLMVWGMGVMVLGSALLPFASFIPEAEQRVWILAATTLGWLGATLYMVNGIPYLTAATQEEERSHAFSLWVALFPLAGFIGALFAGNLPALFGALLGTTPDAATPFQASLWLSTTIYALGLIAVLPTSETAAEDVGAAGRQRRRVPVGIIAALGMVALLRMAGTGAGQTFFNVYLDAALAVPTRRIGSAMAIAQLVGAAAALLAPILMARYGKRHTYVLACLGMALAFLPLALVPNWIAAGAAYVILWTMTSIADPAFQVFGQEAVTPEWRAAVSGASMTAQGLSWAIVGLVGGRAVVAFGYRSLFLIVAVLAAAAALVFWLYFRGPRGEAART
jgi:MFS family permease